MSDKRFAAAFALVRHTYQRMMAHDPDNFLNFMMGGLSVERVTSVIQEADTILSEFRDGTPWILDDAEFTRLVEAYDASKRSARE